MEATQCTESTGPTQRKPKLYWIILLGIAVLALNSLACWSLICRLMGCSDCPWFFLSEQLGDTAEYAAGSRGINVYHEVGVTGVFTPTGSAGRARFDVEGIDTSAVQNWEAMFDEVVEKGFLAIRVPHAPPTYTASAIVSPTVRFTYYSPPATTTHTTISISVTRRTEYESMVNERFPIEPDAQGKYHAHWEVWWIPDGAEPPIPDEPFRLDATGWPQTGQVRYGIDLGTIGLACAGCPLEYLFYNGYVFIGPFGTTILFPYDTASGNPLVAFGAHCGQPTIVQAITPTVPYTHMHWLENYEPMTRTYTITTFSSEGWGYTYYYASPNEPEFKPLTGPPYTVTVGAVSPSPGCLGIMAVHTPTIAVTDTMRETFTITATSVVSDDVQAVAYSFAFAPGYQLDEGGVPPRFEIHLPVVLRNY